MFSHTITNNRTSKHNLTNVLTAKLLKSQSQLNAFKESENTTLHVTWLQNKKNTDTISFRGCHLNTVEKLVFLLLLFFFLTTAGPVQTKSAQHCWTRAYCYITNTVSWTLTVKHNNAIWQCRKTPVITIWYYNTAYFCIKPSARLGQSVVFISFSVKTHWIWNCMTVSWRVNQLSHTDYDRRSSSDTHMLEIQQYKCKTHGFHTFSCSGPHIWNSLTQDLRYCSTLSSFKAKLKIILFSKYVHPN